MLSWIRRIICEANRSRDESLGELWGDVFDLRRDNANLRTRVRALEMDKKKRDEEAV